MEIDISILTLTGMCQGLFVIMSLKEMELEMKRVEIEQNIIAYQHDGKSAHNLGYNIYAFIHDQEALILDTAYSQHLEPVIEDLSKAGVAIVAVLPSHYHPDHFEGLSVLGPVDVYGSQASLKTIQAFELTEEEVQTYGPNKFIQDGDTVSFGDHTFHFELVGGHSACTMFITINDQYVHVGDTYMTLNTGEHSLPYVTWSGLKDHMKALERLLHYDRHGVFKSHGLLIESVSDMKSGIEDRIKYLKALLDSNNTASVAEALKDVENDFFNQAWRAYVK